MIAALGLFASCHSDVPAPPQSSASLQFAADVKEKEGDVTTTYTIPDFRVSAFRNNEWGTALYMDNVVVTRTGINSWIYSPPVDWPEEETVDFFAVSPSSIVIDNNPWWYHTFRYDNSEASTDLLISVRLGIYQTSGRIKLNFRHALSRVQVRLKSSDTSARIHVSDVAIDNISLSGTFYFPVSTTSPETNRGELFDCWKTYNNQDDIIVFSSEDGNSLALDDNPVVVSPVNLFMLPDSLTYFNPDIIWEGSHIRVNYSEEGESRTARIPIREATPEHRWLPGQSYRYTVDLAPTGTRSDNPYQIYCDIIDFEPKK